MKTNRILIILLVISIGIALYLFLKPKSNLISTSTGTNTGTGRENPLQQNQPASQVSTRFTVNGQGTISLITYRTGTNEIIASRNLSFEEAVKALGSYNAVCKIAHGYLDANGVNPCATIRK